MSFYEKGSEFVRKGRDMLITGKEKAIRTSEKALKIQRIKMDIESLKSEKEKKLKDLALKTYEQYTKNMLTDGELTTICQDIKTMQWQIDEKWTEIDNLKEKKD